MSDEFAGPTGYPVGSEDWSNTYADSDERLQAVLRAVGLPELSEEELRHANHGAEMLTDVFFQDQGLNWPYNSSYDSLERRIGEGLAVETINAWNAYRRKREALGDTNFKSLGPMPTTHSVEVWKQRRSISDLDNPFRKPSLLCIMAADPRKAYPLDRFEDWPLVPRDVVGRCDIRISAKCRKDTALTLTPIVRGEFVTAHWTCGACSRWPFAYSAEQVSYARTCEWLTMEDYSVEPTNEDRKAQLLGIADAGVI